MPGSPFKLNPLMRRDKGGSTSLHATYADGYYLELKAQGFISKKQKGDTNTTETAILEIDEGYAVCGLGEGSPRDVSFARPKRAARTWRNSKIWPEAHDSRGVIELARRLTAREEQASSRRLTLNEEVAAWKALRRDVRIRRTMTTKRISG